MQITPNRNSSHGPALPDYLTHEQIEAKLQVNRTTLWRWRRQGRIPFIRIGSAILFDPAAVAAALNKMTVHGRN